MPKFCTKCGKSLEEGMVCECTSKENINENTTKNSETAVRQDIQYGDNNVPVGMYFNRLLSLLKSLIINPATIAKTFILNNDSSAAYGIISITSLCIAIFSFSFFKNIGNLLTSSSNAISSMIPYSFGGTISIDFPYGKIFVEVFFASVIISLFFALILLLTNKVLFKSNSSFKAMVCVVATINVPIAIFSLISALICIISIKFGIFAFSCGILLSYFYSVNALKAASNLTDDKLVYALFMGFLLIIAVSSIIFYKLVPTFLPDAVRTLKEYMY